MQPPVLRLGLKISPDGIIPANTTNDIRNAMKCQWLIAFLVKQHQAATLCAKCGSLQRAKRTQFETRKCSIAGLKCLTADPEKSCSCPCGMKLKKV